MGPHAFKVGTVVLLPSGIRGVVEGHYVPDPDSTPPALVGDLTQVVFVGETGVMRELQVSENLTLYIPPQV